jgi:hypothetical protein
MEPDTTSMLSEINGKLDAVRRSTAVLADIVDRNIGIERIWPNRGVWEGDPSDGLMMWKKRVCQAASRVDIVSTTLWNNWFKDSKFQEEFFAGLARGNAARILIYDPDADVLERRAAHEKDPKGEMRGEIKSTLKAIACHRETRDTAAKKKIRKNLQVRLTNSFYHLAQIIRADDRILVAVYLSGKAGTPSPTFQVRGPGTEYFQTYSEQIEILWSGGREVKETEFGSLAAEPQSPPVRPLRQLLTDYFNETELRNLCFDLDVEYEDLSGPTKADKARELVALLKRCDRISELIKLCSKLRPNVPWEDARA